MTTLESISFTYPSVLLDASDHLSSGLGGDKRRWKPDHLLTREERNRLRREARGINVYDLGFKENIRSVFGDRSKFLAFWPMIRAYRR
jgi:palmitoyltransferase